MHEEEKYYDDEIDLREIVLTLWRGRWIIIILSLVTTIIAFTLSKWVSPKQYQAASYVVISPSILSFNDTSEITITGNLPDIASIVEMSTTQTLLDKVTASTEIASSWNTEIVSMSNMVTATTAGKDQIRLLVNDTDPERAMKLANIWAEQVVEQVNILYGAKAVVLGLDAQVSQSQASYTEAQTALEVELSQNQMIVLTAQLDSKKTDLSCILARSSAAGRILEDLQIFAQSLENQPNGDLLSLGDALALTTLQQRASASQICASGTENPQLQVGNDALANISVVEALATISQMQVSIQTQKALFEKEEVRLEERILSLQYDLENASNQLAQLTQDRDRSQELYAALLQQQSRIETLLIGGAQIASVSTPAVLPKEPVSPKMLMNTVLGLVSGGMLGVFWVFAAAWWQGSEEEEDKKDLRRI